MKSILNFVNICLMMFVLLVSSLFYGCSKENDEQVLPSKGAMTSVVKAVADNVPYIQEVLDEKAYRSFSCLAALFLRLRRWQQGSVRF